MHYRLIPLLVLFSLAAPNNASAQEPQKAPQAAPAAQNSGAPAASQPAAKESWTELTLAKSGLAQTKVGYVELSKVEQPEYTREMLRVQWRKGDPIDLYVVMPHGAVKPPVILYLYDYTSDTDRFRDDHWCKQATAGGVAAVGFVSALSGQRFHAPRPMKQWFVSELQEALATSTHDVQMVLNYLVIRGDVDMDHAGIYGQGSGGAIAILAAEADPRIKALEVLNPWGDWPDWLKKSPQIPDKERATYLKPEFLSKVAGLDPVAVLPHMTAKKLRIQQIVADEITPPSARDKIAAAAPRPDEVVRYKDVTAHMSAWRTEGVNGWLRQQLEPAK